MKILLCVFLGDFPFHHMLIKKKTWVKQLTYVVVFNWIVKILLVKQKKWDNLGVEDFNFA